MMKIKGLLILLILLLQKLSFCQYYDLGQDPASTTWNVLKTENFKIIYPADFDSSIQRLANTLQYVYEYGTITLDHKPKKINVVLHNKSVVSNAFSLWTPQRTEFFTCPPQNTYAQDWLDQLAIHEYRHMIQMDKLNQGFTRILNYVVGQHSTIAVLGLFVPMWYMEGDAVCTETALSHSGRGRVPSFEMKTRAQVLEKGIYSFEEAQLGSSKDYVPDQYYFGYNFVSYARKLWGAEAFESALDYSGKYPFMITPFNHGLKKITGLSKHKMYDLIWDTLGKQWAEQQKEIQYTPIKKISPENKIYTNYKFPHYLNDSIILTEKSGKDDISRVITLDRKLNESKLFTPGFYTSESISLSADLALSKNSPGSYTTDNISLSKGYACWAERDIDTRWAQRDYSVIKIYDFTKKKIIKLTKKTRYFAPYFFPDATMIVVSEVTTDNKYFLTIIDAKSGKEIRKFSSPENMFFTTPSVSADGKCIYAVGLGAKGKSIVAVNSDNGNMHTIVEPGFHEISNALLYKNFVFYNADYSGIDNIYAVDTLSRQIFQVTSSKYGATDIDISPDGKKMVYTDYTADGYSVSEADYDPNSWKPLEQVTDNSIKIYESYLKEEKGIVDSTSVPKKIYESKHYSKLLNVFHPHSWLPFYLDADNIKANPGISIMSQNLLSNTFGTLGYEWDKNTGEGRYHADLTYKGLYPIFNLTYLSGKQAYINDSTKYTYNENNIKLGMTLPFAFMHNQYFRGFSLKVNTNYIDIAHDATTPDNLLNGKAQTMEYKIFLYNQIKTVDLDMRPQWGQSIELNFANTPFKGNNFGSVSSAEVSLLFPGIFRHHSLQVYGGIQDNIQGDFRFSDVVSYPKGYTDQRSDQLKTVSFNYKLPLCYPDINIGSLVYFRKILANAFYDYAEGKYNSADKIYRSYGLDLMTDVNLVRFFIPVYLGIRASYLPAENKCVYNFLFSVDFSGF
jgi:Tol biopolymer transport system component